MNELPKDPVMLLSFVNMKLRNSYPSLTDFCASMDVDETVLKARLAVAGFEYDSSHNRFY